MPCAFALPAVALVIAGQVAVGLLFLVPLAFGGGVIAWVRFRQVTPIIEERKQQLQPPPPSAPAPVVKSPKPPTNVARREASRRAKKGRRRG